MSEQLDRLARNVHEWPDAYDIYTRQQWLDRRAELQNKPSFADHPDAKCFVQGDDGTWYKNTERFEHVMPLMADTANWVEIERGEVLGDWRDTLERRPSDLSEEAVTARLQEATDNVLAAVPELKSDHRYAMIMGREAHEAAEFEPFTSREDAQPELVEMTPEMVKNLKAGLCLVRPFKPAPATPDNLVSHRDSWQRALRRLVELENHEDDCSYWEHELRAMSDMYADLDTLQALCAVHHAAFLHQGCQLLLSEPELVVFRTADGELVHCKPKECLIDPDVYGLAARLLADMSGHPVAPEHMRELAEQMGWHV